MTAFVVPDIGRMNAMTVGSRGGAGGAGNLDNLSKFFGNELLTQPLKAMPPLPSQGQSILTVEEIERRQQVSTSSTIT